MNDTSYKTIAQAAPETKRTEKNSRFLSYAYPITNEEEANAFLDSLRQDHPKATHHCYALRLGTDGQLFRANDDGEPTGSAGRPILGQIDSFELTDVLVVVVRYYGGVKLGVSGLIKAYKSSAHQVLQHAHIVRKEIKEQISFFIPYALVNDFLDWVNQKDLNITEQDYVDTGGHFVLNIPKKQFKDIKMELENRFLNNTNPS